MKFIHAADLHIDSPLLGLSRYQGAPVERIRAATRRAFERLVQLCLDEEVALLVLAGDLFDGDWKDYSTGLFFAGQMNRLMRADVPVVVVRGNHDAASHITKQLALPANVHVFGTRRPETHVFEELAVAVHGQSYARRAELGDLARDYPDAVPGLFNIGVLHTSANGRPGHESYAPTSLSTLQSKGYQYWALGHVHQREVLCEDPWIVFCGNLQGRHMRETGPKGATLVDVVDGRVAEVRHETLDVVRFAQIDVVVPESADADAVVEQTCQRLAAEAEAAEDRTLVARVVVRGPTEAHAAFQREPERWASQIRSLVADLDQLWVEQVRFDTRAPLQLASVRDRKDAVGQVMAAVDALARDETAKARLLESLEDLAAKLPAEVRQGEEALRLDATSVIDDALEDVERMLLFRLTEGES